MAHNEGFDILIEAYQNIKTTINNHFFFYQESGILFEKIKNKITDFYFISCLIVHPRRDGNQLFG